MTNIKDKIPVAALMFVGGGFVVALLIALLLTLPSVKRVDDARHEIKVTEATIEEKRMLDPLYARMVGLKAEQEELGALPVPEKGELEGDISVIFAEMERISRTTGMKTVAVSPCPLSLEAGTGLVKVTMVVEGGYLAFRELLVALLEVPYLHDIPAVEIRAIPEGREYTLRLMVKLLQ